MKKVKLKKGGIKALNPTPKKKKYRLKGIKRIDKKVKW